MQLLDELSEDMQVEEYSSGSGASSSKDACNIQKWPCVILPCEKKSDKKGLAKTVPIPVIRDGGVELVPLNATDPWLHKIVCQCNRDRGDGGSLITEFVENLYQKLIHSRQEPSAAATKSVDAMTPTRKRKGVEMLGLSDSEDDQSVCTPPKPRTRSSRQTVKNELRTVLFENLEITAKARDRGKGVLVQLAGDSMINIIKHLRRAQVEGVARIADAAIIKRARRQEVVGSREEVDGGYIRWDSQSTAWIVFYKDLSGKQHQTSKGLRVDRKDAYDKLKEPKVYG